MGEVYGWHFATAERRLRYGDARPIVLGESHEVTGPVKLCLRGLHASERIIDALKYAPSAAGAAAEAAQEAILQRLVRAARN